MISHSWPACSTSIGLAAEGPTCTEDRAGLRQAVTFFRSSVGSCSRGAGAIASSSTQSIAAAQFPNGGWPRTWSQASYSDLYTLNDGLMQDLIATFLAAHASTRDDRYLAAVRPTIAYLERSWLPDGRLARFYELGTNRPLFMTRGYALTYEDDDLPTHYGFKVVATLDDRGGWVEQGSLPGGDNKLAILDSRTFIKNVGTLAAFVGGCRDGLHSPATNGDDSRLSR